MLLYILLPLAVVGVDQLVKHWAGVSLKAVGTIPLIEGVFHLTYAENTGAAFSLLEGGRWLFLVMTPLAVIALLVLTKMNYFPTRMSKVAVALILGGALGNFIDRVRVGYVVDLFEFRLIRFPVFNVADIALTVGVGLLFIYILTMKEPEKGAGAKEAPDGEPPADHPA